VVEAKSYEGGGAGRGVGEKLVGELVILEEFVA